MKRNLLFTAYLLMCLLFFCVNVFANNARQNDSTKLVSFYYQNENIFSWDFAEPMENWEGVTLNQAGRVVGLDISNNGLKYLYGLENLDALTHLDASFNNLTEIEPLLLQLTNLEELNLNNNNIIDDTFEDFGVFLNLQKLDLSNNKFYGEISNAFSMLNMLSSLKLNDNLLSGCYNSDLLSLCQISESSISEGNNFDADWIDFCQTNAGLCNKNNSPCRQSDSLSLMAFYQNIESGLAWDINQPMDTWEGVTLNNFGCVTKLEVSNQNLKGEIAPEIGNLSQLQKLELNNNNFQLGQIPVELGNLSNLYYLSLYGNDLTGAIPHQVCQLTNLIYLNLADNALKSRIPFNLGNITSLIYLNLCENFLEGNIPLSFGNLENLIYLNVIENKLSGCFFRELKNLCELGKGIYFEDDDDEGDNSFDTNWYNFCNNDEGICYPYNPCRQTDSLTLLKLHENISNLGWNLNKPIDTWEGVSLNGDGCVVSVYIYNIANSSGQLFAEITDFNHLEELVISGANLSGPLPLELFNISTLKTLNLSNNALAGCFPYELIKFCKPTSINSNLDNNNFDDTWDNFCLSTKGSCCTDAVSDIYWDGNRVLFESLYQAVNTIEATNYHQVILPTNKIAIFKAGQYILLQENFTVPQDVDFIMAIDSCK